MAKTDPTPERRVRTDELLVQRLLFLAVWGFAWKLLGRYRTSDADREDIAQNVVVAAWRGRRTYIGARGNLEQWVSRIVRNEAIDFLKKRGRDPLTFGLEVLDEVPSKALPLEEWMFVRALADRVFAMLPENERRVVIAIAVDGYSFRAVAETEQVSPSTVHDRYERGMAALRKAVEDDSAKALFSIPLPLDLAALVGPGGDADPPPELEEEAWQRAVVELGLDRAPDSEPPPSGSRPCRADAGADRPSSRPPRDKRSRFLLLLGPGGMLVGGLLTAALLRGGDRHVPRAEHLPAVVLHSASGIAAGSTMAIGAAPSAKAVPATVATTRPAASRYRDLFELERGLVARGRLALVSGDVNAALALFAEHARRFPEGQNTEQRELLWTEACAHARRALGDAPTPHPGCAGRW